MAAALALSVFMGCSTSNQGLITGVRVPPPPPSSPAGAVLLLEWSCNFLDAARYRDLFTNDYRFILSLRDSASGNSNRDSTLTRDEEVTSARHLLVGGGVHPPAVHISLQFDHALNPVPDPRPGKAATWHKEIVTALTLQVVTPEGGYQISGNALFFLVRGDSAMIPPDLRSRGVTADSTNWWIEQWEDDRILSGSAPRLANRALAVGPISWGELKLLYLPPAPVAARSSSSRPPTRRRRTEIEGPRAGPGV